MRKIKNRGPDEEINFWQSSSDLMTALILVLLLIIMLLILYLIRIPDEDYTNYNAYESSEWSEWTNDNEFEESSFYELEDSHHYDYQEEHDGGDGDGGGDEPGDEPGEHPEEGEGIKSAVYVMLIDAETERTVKEEGVLFELYDGKGGIQILNTYYPNKISYRDYETTKDGVFYLPEKIYEGDYYIHELTEASGYDIADNTNFTIDQLYDWPEPFVVKVPVYPSRNVIRIQMKDAANGQNVGGGSFNIIAAEDIVTLDGTLRYQKGAVVGTIECNEDGYGESEELYLGKYELEQSGIPEYYANRLEKTEHTVVKKTESKNEIEELNNERTKIIFKLTDELKTNLPIAGAEFEVTDGAGSASVATTDENGQIVIDAVGKNTVYTFSQISAPENYRQTSPVKVEVSSSGRISGEAVAEVSAVNRILRVSVNVVDAVLRKPLTEMTLSIFDQQENLVKTLTMNGASQTLTDLGEGTYSVIVNGDEEKKYELTVEDTAQIQNLPISIFTVWSYLALAGAALLAGGFIFGLVKVVQLLVTKKKKKKEEAKE